MQLQAVTARAATGLTLTTIAALAPSLDLTARRRPCTGHPTIAAGRARAMIA